MYTTANQWPTNTPNHTGIGNLIIGFYLHSLVGPTLWLLLAPCCACGRLRRVRGGLLTGLSDEIGGGGAWGVPVGEKSYDLKAEIVKKDLRSPAGRRTEIAPAVSREKDSEFPLSFLVGRSPTEAPPAPFFKAALFSAFFFFAF